MDIRSIKKLVDFINESKVVTEIEVKNGDSSIRISCQNQSTTAMPAAITTAAPIIHPHTPPTPTDTAVTTSTTQEKAAATELRGHVVTAPMVGTMYVAATPEADPLVTIGQKVHAGDTLCIIEAMKMFNPIEADKSGVITARLVDNGEPVEYNQALFTIETD